MARFLAFIFPLLALNFAYAADDAPLPESINWIGITIFLVIFLGGCVGFFWLLWRNEKKAKQGEKNLKA